MSVQTVQNIMVEVAFLPLKYIAIPYLASFAVSKPSNAWLCVLTRMLT